MLPTSGKVAATVVILAMIAQLVRLILAWRQTRRIERIWRRHAALSLTPRHHEDATLHR